MTDTPDAEELGPYKPIDADMPMNARRMVQIPEERRQTHALEYIAKAMGEINRKLDILIAESKSRRDQS